MAIFMLYDAAVSINGQALSDHVKSVELKYEAADLDSTAMGSSTHTRLAGLKDWSATVTFNQDYAAASVDVTLFSLVGAAPFTILIRDTSGANSTTNPQYSGSCILTNYTPAGGKVGELAEATAEFKAAGALSRLTS